ncbi:hypothetical protein [Alloactinosynnema sp. L-07]|nr:hypothetical protein [Alloactinosynnema sp. L-07]
MSLSTAPASDPGEGLLRPIKLDCPQVDLDAEQFGGEHVEDFGVGHT